MAQQNIDFGTFPNDATADAIREAFRKTQENFTELYRDQTSSGVTSLTAGNGVTVVDSAGQPQSAGALVVNSNIAFLNLVSPRRSINFGGASNALSITQSAVINYDVNTSLRLTSLVLTDAGNTGPTSTANSLYIDSGGNIFTNGSLNIPTIKLFTSNGAANAAKRNTVLFANIDGSIDGSPSFTWNDANSALNVVGTAVITGTANIGGNLKVNGNTLFTDLPSISVFATTTTVGNVNAFSYASNINIATLNSANIVIGAADTNGYVRIQSSNSAINYRDGALRVNGGISTQGNIYAVGDIQTSYTSNISAHGSDTEIQFNSGGNFSTGIPGNLRSSENLRFNSLSSTLSLVGNFNASNGTVTYSNTSFTTDGIITTTNAVSIIGNLNVTDGMITYANSPLTTNSSVTINGNLTQNGSTRFSNGNITISNTSPLTTDSSVTINGNLTQNGSTRFSNGNITISNTSPLTTNSSVTINGNLTQNGNASFNNGNVSFTNSPVVLVDANSTLNVTGNATFTGNRFTVGSNTPATIGNTLSVDGILTANSNVAIAGNVAVTGNYTSTSGSVRLTNGNLTTINGSIKSGTGSDLIEISGGTLQVGTTDSVTITSSGDIQATGRISASAGTTGNTQVQFNSGGNLAGDNNFLWDRTTSVLTVTGTANLSTINTTLLNADTANLGNLTAANFIGNGAALSNINASSIASGTLNSNRLPTTGVVAGSYGSNIAVSVITVDQYGRLTSAQSANIPPVNWTTDVGNLSIFPGNAISLVGFANRIAVTTTGNTITVSTPQDIATTSSPTFLSLNVSGQITTTSISGSGAQLTSINASNISGGTLAAARLASSGVTAGSYGNGTSVSSITVDQYGRITSAVSTPIPAITTTTDSGNIDLLPGNPITFRGVANRINVSVSGNTITLTTPQDIGTTSSPTFAGLTVSGTASLGGLSGGGNVSGTWTIAAGGRWQATYADLAEHYEADADYLPGTVLQIGGTHEVTLCTTADSTKIAGVITTEPAYVLNAVNTYKHRAIIALAGRVPIRVTGPVTKGDILTSAGNGTAHVNNTPPCGAIIGRALEDYIPDNDGSEGLITVMIGK